MSDGGASSLPASSLAEDPADQVEGSAVVASPAVVARLATEEDAEAPNAEVEAASTMRYLLREEQERQATVVEGLQETFPSWDVDALKSVAAEFGFDPEATTMRVIQLNEEDQGSPTTTTDQEQELAMALEASRTLSTEDSQLEEALALSAAGEAAGAKGVDDDEDLLEAALAASAEEAAGAKDDDLQKALENSRRGSDFEFALAIDASKKPTPLNESLAQQLQEEDEEDEEEAEALPAELTERSLYDAKIESRLSSHMAPKSVDKSSIKLSQDDDDTSESKHEEKKAKEEILTREEGIAQGEALLKQRLASLRLDDVKMADDGNCQFRAIAHELYASQQYHRSVRKAIVGHLQAKAKDFKDFVGDDKDWRNYLASMARNKCWGDELTLQAASDVFAVEIHLITTSKDHYHLHYYPHDDSKAAAKASPSCWSKKQKKKPRRRLFLSYIAPIHYNVLAPIDHNKITQV